MGALFFGRFAALDRVSAAGLRASLPGRRGRAPLIMFGEASPGTGIDLLAATICREKTPRKQGPIYATHLGEQCG